jgi:hypothetical protein
MSYSVKKAGVGFKVKIDTGPDLSGKSGNFSLAYYNDANPTVNLASGVTFTEPNADGIYFSSTITVANPGDYTFKITNTTDGLGNVSMPVIVTNASLDDIYNAVDTVEGTLATIAADVANIDGDSIAAVQTSISGLQRTVESIQDLINNKSATITFTGTDETSNLVVGETVTGQTSGALGYVTSSTFGTDTVVELTGVVGTFQTGEEISGTGTTTSGVDSVVESNTTIDSVMEFVNQIDAALQDGATGLAALEGFTDDIENMLTGTEFLSDGSTPNPFYDATNPGVASSAEVQAALTTLQAAIGNIDLTDVTNLIGTNSDTVAGTLFGDLYLAKQAIDSNSSKLNAQDTEIGLIKGYVDDLETRLGQVGDADGASVWGDINAIQVEIADGTYGLAAIKGQLDSIEGKVDTINTNVSTLLTAGTQAAVIFA